VLLRLPPNPPRCRFREKPALRAAAPKPHCLLACSCVTRNRPREILADATASLQRNFGKPVEWGMVKQYPWQEAVLMKLDVPLKVDGTPWPLDEAGKPITEAA